MMMDRLGTGRQHLVAEAPIVRVAQENPTWRYTRLRGALKNLKHRH